MGTAVMKLVIIITFILDAYLSEAQNQSLGFGVEKPIDVPDGTFEGKDVASKFDIFDGTDIGKETATAVNVPDDMHTDNVHHDNTTAPLNTTNNATTAVIPALPSTPPIITFEGSTQSTSTIEENVVETTAQMTSNPPPSSTNSTYSQLTYTTPITSDTPTSKVLVTPDTTLAPGFTPVTVTVNPVGDSVITETSSETSPKDTFVSVPTTPASFRHSTNDSMISSSIEPSQNIYQSSPTTQNVRTTFQSAALTSASIVTEPTTETHAGGFDKDSVTTSPKQSSTSTWLTDATINQKTFQEQTSQMEITDVNEMTETPVSALSPVESSTSLPVVPTSDMERVSTMAPKHTSSVQITKTVPERSTQENSKFTTSVPDINNENDTTLQEPFHETVTPDITSASVPSLTSESVSDVSEASQENSPDILSSDPVTPHGIITTPLNIPITDKLTTQSITSAPTRVNTTMQSSITTIQTSDTASKAIELSPKQTSHFYSNETESTSKEQSTNDESITDMMHTDEPFDTSSVFTTVQSFITVANKSSVEAVRNIENVTDVIDDKVKDKDGYVKDANKDDIYDNNDKKKLHVDNDKEEKDKNGEELSEYDKVDEAGKIDEHAKDDDDDKNEESSQVELDMGDELEGDEKGKEDHNDDDNDGGNNKDREPDKDDESSEAKTNKGEQFDKNDNDDEDENVESGAPDEKDGDGTKSENSDKDISTDKVEGNEKDDSGEGDNDEYKEEDKNINTKNGEPTKTKENVDTLEAVGIEIGKNTSRTATESFSVPQTMYVSVLPTNAATTTQTTSSIPNESGIDIPQGQSYTTIRRKSYTPTKRAVTTTVIISLTTSTASTTTSEAPIVTTTTTPPAITSSQTTKTQTQSSMKPITSITTNRGNPDTTTETTPKAFEKQTATTKSIDMTTEPSTSTQTERSTTITKARTTKPYVTTKPVSTTATTVTSFGSLEASTTIEHMDNKQNILNGISSTTQSVLESNGISPTTETVKEPISTSISTIPSTKDVARLNRSENILTVVVKHVSYKKFVDRELEEFKHNFAKAAREYCHGDDTCPTNSEFQTRQVVIVSVQQRNSNVEVKLYLADLNNNRFPILTRQQLENVISHHHKSLSTAIGHQIAMKHPLNKSSKQLHLQTWIVVTVVVAIIVGLICVAVGIRSCVSVKRTRKSGFDISWGTDNDIELAKTTVTSLPLDDTVATEESTMNSSMVTECSTIDENNKVDCDM
ncbi:unnamed protein product [Owenia fusiformis]|uniref:Uncharacterized protein n=1 Tax=Owenia fusiformis TaxID=6347 RepID=A0A8J1UUT8_OWEFU|nr:unnamed protein product [Owenia fusiformis]